MTPLNLRSMERGASIRRLSAVAVFAVTASVLTACQSTASNSPSSGTSTTTTQGAIKVGISSASLQDPFQAALQNAVKSEATQTGFDIVSATNANNDPSKQLTDVGTIVSSGAKGMLIVPRDTSAVVPAIKQATAAGVPVVVLDSTPTGGNAVITVRADSVQMGQLACERIGAKLGGKGKVLELQGDLATTVGRERTDGFETCMKSKFPNITVIAKNTKWQADLAANLAQTTLTANPDTAAIYLESDSVMLPGVLAVMKQLHRLVPVGQSGHVFVATIDGTTGALNALRDNNIDVVISQPLPDYAKYGLAYLKDAIDHKKPPAVGATSHGSRVVDTTGQLEDLLPATVVTKANVDDKSLWGNAGG